MNVKILNLFFVVGFSGWVSASQGKFGDKCSYDSCSSYLYCHESQRRCVCIEGQFDPKKGKCFLRIGDKCEDSTFCPSNTTCQDYTFHDPQSVLAHFGNLDSRERGSVPKRCNCLSGFQINKTTKQCVPILNYKDECSQAKKPGHICDQMAHLTCGPTGTCQCALNGTTYDPVLRSCVVPLGRSCIESDCPQNAWCSDANEYYASLYGHERNHHNYVERLMRERRTKRKRVCECIFGYKVNSAGRCLPDYHVECSKNSPCYHESMTCINGICQCKGGMNANFIKHGNSSECFLLVGGACSKDSLKCAPSSTCTKGHCACDAGLVKGPNGRCHLSQGSVCTPPFTVGRKITVPEPHCDHMKGLACVEGKCACVDAGLKFNGESGLCTAGEGGRCGVLAMVDTVERDVTRAYPTHPFVELYGQKEKTQTHFTIACDEGFECIQQSEYFSNYKKCVKKHKK